MPTKLEAKKVDYSTMSTNNIVNTVRMETRAGNTVSGIDFSTRLPECAQESLNQIAQIFTGNPELSNAFINELLNRIGLVDINYRRYNNPLRMLKRGRLDYGESVEEIAFGLVKGKCDQYAYQGVDDVFKLTIPEVGSAIHKVNLKVKYPLSIRREDLAMAFTSQSSLGSFIEGAINVPYNSANLDEQNAFINLITVALNNGFTYFMEIAPLNSEANDKAFVKTIKSVATRLSWMSSTYNKAGFPTFSAENDLIIIMDAETDAELDVEVLSAAFNMSKVEFMQSGMKIVIPEFPIEGMHALVADRRFFQIYDVYYEMLSILNPSNATYNYFLHMWEIISVSPFVNAIAFVESADIGSITSVTIAPATATIAKGEDYLFKANVVKTGVVNSNVSWSLSGGTDSRVNFEGRVYVGLNETAKTLTLTAVSIADHTKTSTATITVG